MNVKNLFKNIFEYTPKNKYDFKLLYSQNNILEENSTPTYMSSDISKNIDFLKSKYNLLINSDIKIRKFSLSFQNLNLQAILFYIDGMVNESMVTQSILQPLLLKNSINMNIQEKSKPKRIQKSTFSSDDLYSFVYNNLIPHNSITTEQIFENIMEKINSGHSVLFIDKIDIAFCIETKDLKGRDVSEPVTENIIRGAHEAFVENIRTNTSLLRRIINNENLVIEEIKVGKISKTSVAVCYMKNIANENLVSEAIFRINNLKIDYLFSSGQLEQFIEDKPSSAFPQLISTERPDRVSNYILNGRVAIIVNGTPFVLVIPVLFIDFLSTAEDNNLNYHFSNFLKLIRGFSLFFALFLPGFYVAITNYHQELIPSELLFAIVAAREAIPFPVIFEIILMEISFELIREAGLRISSSLSTTIGIIGALILGEAAVSANIVSPILIIVIAFTGICGFAVPDFSLTTAIRIYRFLYIILGFLAGFLGIAFGFFINFIILTNLTSFGIPYFSPYIPFDNLNENNGYLKKPVWKRERRNKIFNTKKPFEEDYISMKWKEGKKND